MLIEATGGAEGNRDNISPQASSLMLQNDCNHLFLGKKKMN